MDLLPLKLFHIRIEGPSLAPGEMSGRDMGQLFSLLEEMVEAAVVDRHPSIKRGEVHIAPRAILPGSVCLQMSSHQLPAYEAFEQLAASVSTGDFSDVPIESHAKLKEFAQFLSSRNYSSTWSFQMDGETQHLAQFTPDLSIPDPEEYMTLKGGTTVHGRILYVGGPIKPRVEIQTTQGKFKCYMSEEQARSLAPRLFERVGLRGTVFWDSRTWNVKKMEVEEILPYRETSIAEAFRDLASEFGEFFDDMDNPNEWIEEQRRSDSDE